MQVFELMSDSLMTTLVEPHQCPLHQSILLTQGSTHKILGKKIRYVIGRFGKYKLVGHFDFDFF